MALGGKLRPHQIPRACWQPGPSTCESKTWCPSKCQVLAASGACTLLPGGAALTGTDTAEVIAVRKAQVGFPGCQQAWTAHGEVCASAPSGFAAHPGLPAAWVVQHVLQRSLPAAAEVWIFLAGAECLQMITAAQSRAISSCLACSELPK